MREELEKQLCAKYPEIFRDRHAPMTETCMCWGFECGDGWYDLIDRLCTTIKNHQENLESNRESNVTYAKIREAALNGDWEPFNEWYLKGIEKERHADWIQNMREQLLEDIPPWLQNVEPVEPVVASQVKEKYGTLRFYRCGGDEYIMGAISMAESMSARICEVCGNPGKVRNGGWVQTLCDTHAEDRGYGPVSLEDEFTE